jgi:hypothetical protein
VIPHEFIPHLYFKRWSWQILMVSLNAQAKKGGTPALPTLYPLPFTGRWDKYIDKYSQNILMFVCLFSDPKPRGPRPPGGVSGAMYPTLSLI